VVVLADGHPADRHLQLRASARDRRRTSGGSSMTTLTTTPVATAPGGSRKRGKQREKRGERILHWFTWGLIIWLALPIAVVILFSFNNPHGRFNYTWTGFTLKWWGPALFKYPELTSAMVHSIEVAVIATLGATILGTLVGLALGKYRFRGQSAT